MSEECPPLKIGVIMLVSQFTWGDITMNSLSNANDLNLISETSEGLQKCLDKLHSYCYKWGLTVN